MTAVIVLRPQPGCDASVAALRELGLEALGYPLFAVAPRRWSPPAPDSFDALLIGSANALRHAGSALGSYRGKPAYAVGKRTAGAASQAGLAIAQTGSGGLQELLGALDPAHRRLLRLAGEVRVALEPPSGVAIAEHVVYASEPVPMPSALCILLQRPALVLLHSGEAARHFAAECTRLGIVRELIAIAALAPRIAEAAGEGWQTVGTAPLPQESALLALAAEMCETLPSSPGTAPEN